MHIRELSAHETGLAYTAMLELRPTIGTEETFVERVNQVQRPEGYRLIGALIEGEEQAAAVAGFRVVHHLAWGQVLYCDDLSCHSTHRRLGLAGALLDWMIAEAERLGCESIQLDSGVGANRQDAHRLYMNKRMRISSYHFARDLGGPGS